MPLPGWLGEVMSGGAALPQLRWPGDRRPLAWRLEPLGGLSQRDWVGPAVAEGSGSWLKFLKFPSLRWLCFLMLL